MLLVDGALEWARTGRSRKALAGRGSVFPLVSVDPLSSADGEGLIMVSSGIAGGWVVYCVVYSGSTSGVFIRRVQISIKDSIYDGAIAIPN